MDWHSQKRLLLMEILSEFKRNGILGMEAAKFIKSLHSIRNPQEFLKQATELLKTLQKSQPQFKLPGSEVNGPIGIGISENKQIVGIYPEECHVLLSGQTGTGKTTLIAMTFAQALNRGMKVWLFVRAKDLRNLLRVDEDIFVINFDGSVKLNLLNSGNIERLDYGNIFVDIFIQSQKLYDGSKNYLLEMLSEVHRKYDNSGRLPAVQDLYDYILATKPVKLSRNAMYRDSALNRLGGMLSGSLGRVLDCSRGYEEEILNHSCIFEIGNLTTPLCQDRCRHK